MTYRIVNIWDNPNYKIWIIDKRHKFLWFTWWNEIYRCHDYYICRNRLNRFNGLKFEYDNYEEMVKAVKSGITR